MPDNHNSPSMIIHVIPFLWSRMSSCLDWQIKLYIYIIYILAQLQPYTVTVILGNIVFPCVGQVVV